MMMGPNKLSNLKPQKSKVTLFLYAEFLRLQLTGLISVGGANCLKQKASCTKYCLQSGRGGTFVCHSPPTLRTQVRIQVMEGRFIQKIFFHSLSVFRLRAGWVENEAATILQMVNIPYVIHGTSTWGHYGTPCCRRPRVDSH